MSSDGWKVVPLLGLRVWPWRVLCVDQGPDKRPCQNTARAEGFHKSDLSRLIKDLSQTPPDRVTRGQLRELASLNLCTSHGKERKINDIASVWNDTIDEAAKYSYCMEGAPRSSPTSSSTPSSEISKNETYADDLRKEITNLQSNVDSLERQKKRHEEEREKLEEQNKRLESHVSQMSRDFDSDRAGLQDQLENAKSQVQLLQSDVSRIQNEYKQLSIKAQENEKDRSQLRETNENLQAKATNAAEERDRMKSESKTQASMLEQSRDKLQKERLHTSDLKKRITELEALKLTLSNSIATCWLHTCSAWLKCKVDLLKSTWTEMMRPKTL